MLRAEMEKIKLEVKLPQETGVVSGAGNPNGMQQELGPGTQHCVLGPLPVPERYSRCRWGGNMQDLSLGISTCCLQWGQSGCKMLRGELP